MHFRPVLTALTLAAVPLLFPAPGMARELDPLGNSHDFVAACRLADRMDGTELSEDQAAMGLLCMAYTAGVWSAVSAHGRYELGPSKICAGAGERPRTIIAKLVQRANAHPEALDRPGLDPTLLVIEAIAELHPCPTSSR